MSSDQEVQYALPLGHPNCLNHVLYIKLDQVLILSKHLHFLQRAPLRLSGGQRHALIVDVEYRVHTDVRIAVSSLTLAVAVRRCNCVTKFTTANCGSIGCCYFTIPHVHVQDEFWPTSDSVPKIE